MLGSKTVQTSSIPLSTTEWCHAPKTPETKAASIFNPWQNTAHLAYDSTETAILGLITVPFLRRYPYPSLLIICHIWQTSGLLKGSAQTPNHTHWMLLYYSLCPPGTLHQSRLHVLVQSLTNSASQPLTHTLKSFSSVSHQTVSSFILAAPGSILLILPKPQFPHKCASLLMAWRDGKIKAV